VDTEQPRIEVVSGRVTGSTGPTHLHERKPHGRIEDDTRPVTYSLRLTIDEAERLRKLLAGLVTEAVQGY